MTPYIGCLAALSAGQHMSFTSSNSLPFLSPWQPVPLLLSPHLSCSTRSASIGRLCARHCRLILLHRLRTLSQIVHLSQMVVLPCGVQVSLFLGYAYAHCQVITASQVLHGVSRGVCRSGAPLALAESQGCMPLVWHRPTWR